jgi:hypothetical protein
MFDDLNWLTRFFSYSSIQVKFIASFAGALSLAILNRIFIKILFRQTSNALIRYRWQKISSYVVYVLGIFIIGQIWFKGWR